MDLPSISEMRWEELFSFLLTPFLKAILALFLDGAKFLETDQLTVNLTQGLQAGTNFTLYNLMALVGEIGAPIDGTPRPIDETPIGGLPLFSFHCVF